MNRVQGPARPPAFSRVAAASHARFHTAPLPCGMKPAMRVAWAALGLCTQFLSRGAVAQYAANRDSLQKTSCGDDVIPVRCSCRVSVRTGLSVHAM